MWTVKMSLHFARILNKKYPPPIGGGFYFLFQQICAGLGNLFLSLFQLSLQLID